METNNNNEHQLLNDQQFGDYFGGGSCKENNDIYRGHSQDQNINTYSEMASKNGLTPLDTNTKLSGMTPTKVSRAKTRIFEAAKPMEHDEALPPLPNTPSPPRRRSYYIKQGMVVNNKFSDLLKDEYHYDEAANFNPYDPSLNNANFNPFSAQNGAYSNNYPQTHQQPQPQWPRYDYSNSNGPNFMNFNDSSFVNEDKENNDYDRFGGGYSNNFNQRAPRFQMIQQQQQQQNKQVTNRNLYRERKQCSSSTQCKFWANGAVCRNGKLCPFSHNSQCDNQRKRVTNYKTKPCVDPGRGFKCEYGDRCNFAHPGQALRRPMPIQYADKQYFSLLLRDCATNRYPFGIFV